MDYEHLTELIFDEVKKKLERNKGLSIFARERAKFEGWLKVELCDSLSKYFEVVPEKNRIDITSNGWGIQLKTVNTNIRFANVKAKSRPITKNTEGVIDDIQKLSKTNFSNKAVVFVVFPVIHENKDWQKQLERISGLLKELRHVSLNFKNGIPGVVYLSLV